MTSICKYTDSHLTPLLEGEGVYSPLLLKEKGMGDEV